MRMLQDRGFVELFKERWEMARESFLHTDSLMEYIDSTVSYLADPIARNYKTWPLIAEDLFSSNYISTSYENEIFNIKDWLYARLEWIDDNIGNIYYDIDIYDSYEPAIAESYFGFEIYPVPFSDELNIVCSSSGNVRLRNEIYDVSGQLKYSKETLVEKGISQIAIRGIKIISLTPGIYFLRVIKDDVFVSTRKIIKH